MKEYVIWGKPEGETEEQVLYSLARSQGQADKVMTVLAEKYNCRDMRVQILDLSEPFHFVKEAGIG